MELLLIYRPRRDGRLSWRSWLTHSGLLTHEVVTRQPWIRRRSGKVRQLQTDVLTTEPRRQLLSHAANSEGRAGSEEQSHKEEEKAKEEEELGRGLGPLPKEGELYLDISARVPEFLVTPLLVGLVCLLSQGRFEEPVRSCVPGQWYFS